MDGFGRDGWVVSVDILIIIPPPGTIPTIAGGSQLSFGRARAVSRLLGL